MEQKTGSKKSVVNSLLLIALFVCATAITSSAAANITGGLRTERAKAVPRPTPPDQPLDADAAAALIEDLKVTLNDFIADEETIGKIGEKWDAKSLAGKTRSQILASLFADLTAVVTDKTTSDKIWASWRNVGVTAAETEPKKTGADEDKTEPVKTPPDPQPKPKAQDDGLNEDQVKALIESLAVSLEDFVGDETAAETVSEKWNAHTDLAGKKKADILKILLADVRSVITDKTTLEKFQASWFGGEINEQDVPNAKVEEGLDELRKAQKAADEQAKLDEGKLTTEPTEPVDPNAEPLPKGPNGEEMIEVEPPPLNEEDMKAVMNWIGVKVGAERLPFCWRESYGRGAGDPLSTCTSENDKNGALCYPKCREGFSGNGPVCWQNCPSGIRDDGGHCFKPDSYGRGGGYGMAMKCLPTPPGQFRRFCSPDPAARAENCEKDHGKGNCEQWGLMFYPKCKPGFHAVGCCVCSPDCPAGMSDIGVSCQKQSYGRTAGTSMLCAPGLEQNGALCYPKCRSEFHGVGPVCWQNCPAQQPFDCGAGCATGMGECAKAVFDQVFSPIMAAITLATWGRASAIGGAAKAAKIATSAGRLTKAFNAIKNTLTVAKNAIEKAVGGAENVAKLQKIQKMGSKFYKFASGVGKEVDHFTKEFAESFEDQTSKDINAEIDKNFGPQAALAIKKQWAINMLFSKLDAEGFATAKNVLTIVSAADPTGIVGVAEAFMHPICGKNTPFPKVTPLYNY